MAGLLSGLEQFGLKNLENMNLYEKPKKAENGEDGKPAAPVVQEQDFLFDKSYFSAVYRIADSCDGMAASCFFCNQTTQKIQLI